MFNIKEKNKRSPLKARALRNPGQSLDDQIHRILSEDISIYLALATIFVLLAVIEWIRFYFKSPPFPFPLSILAIIAVWISFYKRKNLKGKIRNLELGREGEKAVGQYLDLLREKGYKIFHDISSENFNIDHVIIGLTGIYVIETKTISKPLNRKPVVEYDGENILVDGHRPDRNPIIQAKSQASWLKEFIEESTGKKFKIRPVVLYPGWYIEEKKKGNEVWVLEPKALQAFLKHENKYMSTEDAHLVSYHLSRYVRTFKN